MDNYPPYNITDEMLSLVASVVEKTRRLAVGYWSEGKPQLRRNNRIQSIHASLAIESNSLSLGQVQDVIDGRAVLGPPQEIREVKNAYEAYDQLPHIDPFDMKQLLKLHGIMTAGLVLDAGAFRRGEEGVFADGKCIFMAPPARLVHELMENLFGWLKSSRFAVHPLLLSSVFHYELVFIHPFSDGNGRLARLWQTALLMQWEDLFQYLPIENQIQRYQAEYYQAISDSHIAGESTAFIVFMLKMIDEVLADLTTSTGHSDNPCVERLLSVMAEGRAYTAQELLELLGLKSRLGLRKNYLQPALAENLIQMTLPDKPTSRHQRYIFCLRRPNKN